MQQMGKLRPYHIVLWGGDKKKKKDLQSGTFVRVPTSHEVGRARLSEVQFPHLQMERKLFLLRLP